MVGNTLLEYYKRTVKECLAECDGVCHLYIDGHCECVDANVLDNLKELKEYKDAEEQGLLLRLPCKEGEVAWCTLENTRYYYGGVYEVTVEEIEWSSGSDFEVMVRFKEDEQSCKYMRFHSFEFGERIFFGDNAKAEAEAALEKMKGEGHEN